MLENVVKRSEFVYTREQRDTKVIYYYYYFLLVVAVVMVVILALAVLAHTQAEADIHI